MSWKNFDEISSLFIKNLNRVRLFAGSEPTDQAY